MSFDDLVRGQQKLPILRKSHGKVREHCGRMLVQTLIHLNPQTLQISIMDSKKVYPYFKRSLNLEWKWLYIRGFSLSFLSIYLGDAGTSGKIERWCSNLYLDDCQKNVWVKPNVNSYSLESWRFWSKNHSK